MRGIALYKSAAARKRLQWRSKRRFVHGEAQETEKVRRKIQFPMTMHRILNGRFNNQLTYNKIFLLLEHRNNGSKTEVIVKHRTSTPMCLV